MNTQIIDAFIADLFAKNRSPRTQEAYRRDLAAFGQWYGAEIADATRLDVTRYTRYLRSERHYRVVTTLRNLSALRSFFKFLQSEELRSDNPVQPADLKREQRRPKVLKVAEVVALLSVRLDGPNAIRDRAILELLYGSGLRRAELAGVTLENVDFASKSVTVIGKGDKQRTVPLTDASIAAMQTYLHVRPESPCRAFFLSNRKGALGLRQVWGIVHRAARAANLSHASTHSLRHSFATHLIVGGCDLPSVKDFMGPTNIATTQVYIDLDPAHKRSQFTLASLRDRPEFNAALAS